MLLLQITPARPWELQEMAERLSDCNVDDELEEQKQGAGGRLGS